MLNGIYCYPFTYLYILSVQKFVPPVVKVIRPPTDTPEDYVRDYGYFGQIIYTGVLKERQVAVTTITPGRPAVS